MIFYLEVKTASLLKQRMDLTFPGLENQYNSAIDVYDDFTCQEVRNEITRSMTEVRQAISKGIFSRNMIVQLTDLRRSNTQNQINTVIEILKSLNLEKDQELANVALIIALDRLPDFSDYRFYDNTLCGYARRLCFKKPFGNPVEGQEIITKNRGLVKAINVGVFTMTLE